MINKDYYDIVISLASLYSKALQFFIAICTLVGGWAIASGSVEEMDLYERVILLALFTCSTGTLVFGEVNLLRRINAALKLCLITSKGDSSDCSDLEELCKLHPLWPTIFGMVGVIVFLDVIILII